VKLFPIINTIKSYSLNLARDDLIAAITVTIMLVPQSLAYAMLAGLPPEVGLYSSILPLFFYALFGTSGSLAVGPVAVLALMTGATISQVSTNYGYSSVDVAIALAMISGIMLMLMGLCRMGFIVNFISRSVIEGFITASAILIAFSQLKHIFSVNVEGHELYSIVKSLIEQISLIHLPTLFLGSVVLFALLSIKPALNLLAEKIGVNQLVLQFGPRIAPAIMVVLTVMAMQFTGLGELQISTVGFIPDGISDLSIPNIDNALLKLLILPSALLAIIGYVESISVASKFAAKSRDHIDANSELLGLGAANVGSAFSGGMPVTGGFSRSVVNYSAGSKTPLSGVLSAIFIAIILMGMMGLLKNLPKATLAAAIIAAVIGLIDLKRLKVLWKYSKSDFFLMFTTIAVTLFSGVELGISTGILLSICLHLYHTSKPHIAIIGQVPGTEHYRNVLRHQVDTVPEIIGIRIDGSLYFANANYLEHEITDMVSKNTSAEHCVLMCASVSDIDASALESLETIHDRLADMNVELHLSEVKGPVMDKLRNSDLAEKLAGRIHLSHDQAIKHLSTQYDSRHVESDVYETNNNPLHQETNEGP
jgi:SulP family sulfate permease